MSYDPSARQRLTRLVGRLRRNRRWQIVVVIVIALVETLIRLASDQALPLPLAF